jgi:hypothetical protein
MEPQPPIPAELWDQILEFPKESGQWVNGYWDRSYAAGVTYPSEECSRWLL